MVQVRTRAQTYFILCWEPAVWRNCLTAIPDVKLKPYARTQRLLAVNSRYSDSWALQRAYGIDLLRMCGEHSSEAWSESARNQHGLVRCHHYWWSTTTAELRPATYEIHTSQVITEVWSNQASLAVQRCRIVIGHCFKWLAASAKRFPVSKKKKKKQVWSYTTWRVPNFSRQIDVLALHYLDASTTSVGTLLADRQSLRWRDHRSERLTIKTSFCTNKTWRCPVKLCWRT